MWARWDSGMFLTYRAISIDSRSVYLLTSFFCTSYFPLSCLASLMEDGPATAAFLFPVPAPPRADEGADAPEEDEGAGICSKIRSEFLLVYSYYYTCCCAAPTSTYTTRSVIPFLVGCRRSNSSSEGPDVQMLPVHLSHRVS